MNAVQDAQELLSLAQSLSNFSFYTFAFEDKPVKLCSRIPKEIETCLKKHEVEKLEAELNAALKPVAVRWGGMLLARAQELIKKDREILTGMKHDY